jgi:hypothetical protein
MSKERIYSLNLIAYLKVHGFLEEAIQKDERGNYYYVFANCIEVFKTIEDFRRDEFLQCYLSMFKEIKQALIKNKNY